MKDSTGEAVRWLRSVVLGHSVMQLADGLRAEVPGIGELMEAAGTLDQYYVPTRYPNGLPGGVPFEAFGERQVRAALEDAARFVALAVDRVRG